MFRNYILITLRSIRRQKLFSLINLGGLSIGLCATMLIVLYVTDELRYDNFHEDKNRIYRIGMWSKSETGTHYSAKSCAPLLETLVSTMPEVSSGVRFGIWNDVTLFIGNEQFTAPHVWVSDPNFFSFFSFPLVHGDKNTVLVEANKVVLTRKAAVKYFGKENAVGEMFEMNTQMGRQLIEVSGIAEDIPSNSHLQFEMVLSGITWWYLANNHYWLNTQNYTYIKTQAPLDAAWLTDKVTQAGVTFLAKDISKVLGYSMEKFQQAGNDMGFHSQPVSQIHLHSRVDDEITSNGKIEYVYVFSCVAFLILLLAVINFVNLYTARLSNRAKEVGIRKVSGAVGVKLRWQFILEAVVFTALAGFLALVLCSLILSFFNDLIGKEIQFSQLLSPRFVLLSVLVILMVGVLAGVYPAVYLSSFQPAEVLKGKISLGLRGIAFRNFMIVFQFSIAIMLITSSLVMFRQFNYMLHKELGFNKHDVIVVKRAHHLRQNREAFVNELKAHPSVLAQSFSSGVPPQVDESGAFRLPGSEKDFTLSVLQADAGMLSTLGLTMKAGRFFSEDFASDSTAVILNESAMKLLGWNEPENQELLTFFGGLTSRKIQVIGVVKDFHFKNLYDEIRPMAMLPKPHGGNFLTIKAAGGQHEPVLVLVHQLWKKYVTSTPLEFNFLDNSLALAYERDKQSGQIILVFTLLSVLVAGLGLFGLTTYVLEQRAREISIRKVLGASIPGLLVLLNKDFMKLTCGAVVLGLPTGMYIMELWLQNFPYRSSLPIGLILIPALVIVLFTGLIVSLQAWVTANTNPTHYLKNE